MTVLVVAGLGGLIAGVITTVAGIGGGITLVAVLSGFLEPKAVVGLTAPVLMVGNLSRVALFRDELDLRSAGWVLAGGVPAVVLGAVALPRLPGRAIQIGMAFLLLGFVAYQLLARWRRRPDLDAEADAAPTRALVDVRFGIPVGVALGGLSATVGGAGPIGAPFFHARGLTKGAFAATSALTNGTLHALKTVIFLASGILALSNVPASAVAAVTVSAGNRIGKSVLGRISEETFVRLLLATIVLAALRLLLVGD